MGVNGVLVEILGNVEEVTVDPIPIPSQEQLLCGGNPAAIRLSFRVTNISEEVIRIWALAADLRHRVFKSGEAHAKLTMGGEGTES
ncbi:MAG: hypothetical protein CL912_09580 [Deltaproteobacteria bacterium]|nr:hypothetical protein [Deltaproteobacteria bacterium]